MPVSEVVGSAVVHHRLLKMLDSLLVCIRTTLGNHLAGKVLVNRMIVAPVECSDNLDVVRLTRSVRSFGWVRSVRVVRATGDPLRVEAVRGRLVVVVWCDPRTPEAVRRSGCPSGCRDPETLKA